MSKTLNIDAKFSNPIYLDDNNITVKAKEWSKINDEGVIDGEYYRVVNEGLLKEFIEKGGVDLSKVVTTKITDMSDMFSYTSKSISLFNWDGQVIYYVSNVYWSFMV